MLLSGCRGEEQQQIPTTLPDISGSVTAHTGSRLEENSATLQITVEAADGIKANYPNAVITIDQHTLIESKKGKRLKVGQLHEGLQVDVWFGKGVMETVPVQATAKAIRIRNRQ